MGKFARTVVCLLVLGLAACSTTELIDRDQVWVQDVVVADNIEWEPTPRILDATIRMLREQTLRQGALSKEQKTWTVEPNYLLTVFITKLRIGQYDAIGIDPPWYYRVQIGGVAVLAERSGSEEQLVIPFWHPLFEAHDKGFGDPKLITRTDVMESFAAEVAAGILDRLPLAGEPRSTSFGGDQSAVGTEAP